MKLQIGTILDFIMRVCSAYQFPYKIEQLKIATITTESANEQSARIEKLKNWSSFLKTLYLVVTNAGKNSCNKGKNAMQDEHSDFRVLVIIIPRDPEITPSSPTTQSSVTSAMYREFTLAANNVRNNSNLIPIQVVREEPEEESDCESSCVTESPSESAK